VLRVITRILPPLFTLSGTYDKRDWAQFCEEYHIKMQRSVKFLLEDLFWLLKITTNSHILAHVNTERLVDMYSKLKTSILELILANHKYIPVAYARMNRKI